MKFIAIFAAFVLATVSSATTVHPSTSITCHGKYNEPIYECGINKLFDTDVNMAAAKIVYDGRGVTFYDKPDCTGFGALVELSIDCFEVPIRAKCIYINCYD